MSDEHDEMQLVMKSGEVLESKSVWHPIKCSHSGISCGTMYGQSCIGQFRSLKTVRQSNFRIDSDAFVPSYPCSRATSQNFIHLLTLGAHAREGYGSRRVCLSVCLSVCPSVRLFPL